MDMLTVWLVLAGVFLVIELLTVSLVSLWFVVGSLAAVAAYALGAAAWVQIVCFIAVSGLCFALLYPRMKRLLKRNRHATNADMVLGATCVVTHRINNLAGEGAVSVGGKTWTARTADGEEVPEGHLVRVDTIQGVKLIVTPLPQPAAQATQT